MSEQDQGQQPELKAVKDGVKGSELALVMRLRDLYEHSGYNGLSELASAVDLSSSQVSRLLSGDRRPPRTFFDVFFAALKEKNGRGISEEMQTDTLRLYYNCIRDTRPYEYKAFELEQQTRAVQKELASAERLVTQIRSELVEVRAERDSVLQKFRALEQAASADQSVKSEALDRLQSERAQYERSRIQLTEEISELTDELRQAEAERDDAVRRCEDLQEKLKTAKNEAYAAAQDEAQRQHAAELDREREKSRSLESQLKALQQKMESVLAARQRLGIDEEAPSENINQNASRKSHPRWFSRNTKTGVLPVDGPVTKKYKEMIRSDLHPGIDFSVPTGTPVKAIQAGRVVQAGWNGRYGYQVTLHHYDDTFSCYAHLSAISVKQGNPVMMGQKIGSSGATGNTETPHLHFEVRTTAAAGDDIDPVAYLATLGVSVMGSTAADAVATPTTTPQAAVPQPTEFLVSAEIRRLRSHQESERAHAVTELQTLANELPHSIPNIIEALCSYIRRPSSEYGSEKRPPSVLKALGAVLVMPRPRDAPLILKKADLSGLSIKGVDLSKSQLQEADLRKTKLESVNLADAELDGADLRGADLSQATGITRETIRKTRIDETTVFASSIPQEDIPEPQSQPSRERKKKGKPDRPRGPWDIKETTSPEIGRVDLGGLLVPGVDGMELRVEVAGDAIVAATVVLRDSAIQLQAFAAPKREGIWDEVREELASKITQQGGVIDEVEGPLGWELRAQVPVQLPDGTGGFQVVRFVGVDGPRWFLRGLISGQGAVQPQAAGLLEQIFRDTVVVRGEGPMAPWDPIALQLPNDAQMVPEAVRQEEQAASPRESA